MKTALLAFFFFFLLFAFTTIAEFVYDTDNKPLKNTGKYYFSPRDPIGGAEVTYAALGGNGVSYRRRSKKVHPWMANAYLNSIRGPLYLHRQSLNNRIRRFSKDTTLHCQFVQVGCVGVITCRSATVMFGDYPVVRYGRFFIKPLGNGSYKLVFCTNYNAEVCGDIGTRLDSERNWRLVVTDKDRPTGIQVHEG